MHINAKYKIIIVLFFCILIHTSVVKAQSAYKIFVAVNGTEGATGTQEQPVNNIARAIELAEKAAKTDVKKIEIIVHGGTYYIAKSIEIVQGKNWTSSVPLSIEAYEKEIVILHGGKTITNDMISPVTDKGFFARFHPEVRNRIRQIDLKAAGVDPGKLHPVGFGRPFGPSWMEVFFNGTPGQIARWPNVGTVPIDSVLNGGSADTAKKVVINGHEGEKEGLIAIRPSETNREVVNFKPTDISKKAVKPAVIDTAKKGGVFFYDDPRPSTWKEPQKVWLTGFFMWGYADDAVPVQKIDTIRRIIKTALPTRYGFGSGKPWRAYYAYNIPEEIDVPGEYYVDTENGMLYFLPPDKLKSVELSVIEAPIIQVEGVNNLQIKKIQFTCSRGMGIYTERTKGLRIDGCKFTNLGMMGIFVGRDMEAVEGEKAAKPEARVTGDVLNYIYKNTTFDSEGGSDNGIINCQVYQTGEGGIYLSGGNRLTLTASHSFVKNCMVHDFNRIGKTFMPGIYISGVGNTISSCELYNSPSVGIMIHGNNHIIEYNDIHHTTREVDDMGAVYIGRDPSERGNIIRYNYFHNLGGTNKTEAVYNDDGACGTTVTGNIFYRAGTVACFMGGGQDNQYTYNLILNTRYALHVDKRLNNWAKGVLQKDGLFQKRLEAVNYLKPPYSTAYPNLKNYFENGPDAPQHNRFFMNVMVNLEHLVEGDTSVIYFDKRNFETIGDPGFKNYRKLDFRLKSNSIIYNELPGFVLPPFEKIGYHKNDD
jgi:hypothetical protein